jgi:nucleoside-diphosphate-sugar epimerase
MATNFLTVLIAVLCVVSECGFDFSNDMTVPSLSVSYSNGNNGSIDTLQLVGEHIFNYAAYVRQFCRSSNLSAHACRELFQTVEREAKTILTGPIHGPNMIPFTRDAPLEPAILIDHSKYIYNYVNNSIRIAVIGATGYLGSFLLEYLAAQGHHVTGFGKHECTIPFEVLDWDDISAENVRLLYDVVIYLEREPHTVASLDELYQHMVTRPLEIARLMNSRQYFVFMSSSQLAGGFLLHGEDDTVISLDDDSGQIWVKVELTYRREFMLRALSNQQPESSPVMVGFRVGEVIGVSPLSQRIDLSVQSLLREAYTLNRVNIPLAAKDVYVSLLSMHDFGRAVAQVVKTPWLLKRRFEVFNLQSSGNKLEQIAHEVAKQTGVIPHLTDRSSCPSVSAFVPDDFSRSSATLSVAKFQETFEFFFRSSLESIVRELVNGLPESVASSGIHDSHSCGRARSEEVMCPVCLARKSETAISV